MTVFASDTFTGADDTRLTLHTSDSGHTWSYSGIANTAPGYAPKIYTNVIKFAVAGGEHVISYSSAIPSSPEYVASCVVAYKGATTDLAGPMLGVAASSAANSSSYGYLWHISPQSPGFRLRRYDGTTPVNVVVVAATITSGVSYKLVIGRATGGVITCKVQRLSDSLWLSSAGTWGASEVEAVSVTDTTHTTVGRPAISTYSVNSYSWIDTFSAEEVSGGGVTATGSLAVLSLTSPTVTANGAAAATGSVSSIALVAPTASASGSASGEGSATGSLAFIQIDQPTATAAGAASATGSLRVITLTAPTATAAGAASATGSLRVITLTAPTATASGSVAGSGTLTFPLTNNTGTLLVGETGVTAYVYTISGTHVVTKTGQTTNGSGVMTVIDPLIVAATQYRAVIVLASGDEGMDKATAV